MRTFVNYSTSLILVVFVFGLAACTPMVKQAFENQKPQVSVVDQRLTGLNFERVSVALNALNYDLTINGKHWVSGNSQTLGDIKEKQKSLISLPVTISLMDLGSGFSNLLKSFFNRFWQRLENLKTMVKNFLPNSSQETYQRSSSHSR